jgi:hypothetical protein
LCYGLLIGVLLAFCFYVQTLLYINDDDTFYLFTAERLLQGGSFLNVVHDTNPPLINFIYMPPVLVARLFAIPLFLVFIGYIYLLIASALVMIWKLVPLQLDKNPHFSRTAFVLFAFLLAVMPAHDFAEREHLVTILCAPWMCLVARRWSGIDTSLKASIACTTFAAIAFALKPYFLPLPLAVFIVDMLRDRSRRRAFSAENLTFAFWGLCYLGALFLWIPGWFAIALDLPYTYFHYDQPWQGTLGTTLFFNLPAGLCIAICLLAEPVRQLRALVVIIGWAVVASTISPIAQNKMFTYHFVPLQIELGVVAGLIVLLAIRQWRDRRWVPAAAMILIACAGATAAKNVFAVFNGTFKSGNFATVAQVQDTQLYRVLHDEIRGKSVMTISTAGAPLAVLLHAGASTATRFFVYFYLPYIAANKPNIDRLPPNDAARLERLDAFLKQAAVEDIQLYSPDFIFFETTHKLPALAAGFDIQDYFKQSSDFAKELSNYELYRGDHGSDGSLTYWDREFRVYKRVGPGANDS